MCFTPAAVAALHGSKAASGFRFAIRGDQKQLVDAGTGRIQAAPGFQIADDAFDAVRQLGEIFFRATQSAHRLAFCE